MFPLSVEPRPSLSPRAEDRLLGRIGTTKGGATMMMMIMMMPRRENGDFRKKVFVGPALLNRACQGVEYTIVSYDAGVCE